MQNKKPMAIAIALCASLLSFISIPGGDKFEVYLNNKMILEHFVTQRTAQYLTLHQSNYNDRIDIYYSHCGKIGTSRYIVIKDEQDKVLKQWQFPNATAENRNMTWKVKEIMDLQKGKDRRSFKLYYISREIPGGKLLATVVMANSSYTKVQ
jgi:hypothetical protein